MGTGACRIVVVLPAVLVAGACATSGTRGMTARGPEETGRSPASPAARNPWDSAPAPAAGEGDVLVFRRPASCGDAERWPSRRDVLRCRSEDRLEVRVTTDGRYATRLLPPEEPRNPYPFEVARQWRHCPFAADARLEAQPRLFAAYEDPDVGRCYLFRPVDPATLAAAGRRAGLSLLDGLHPYVADSVRQLVARAREEGIKVKVISGVRPHTQREVWVPKKSKKDGKATVTKVRKVVYRKTWHTWGLAVDVNLEHRNDLAAAVKAYRADPDERHAWSRVGELGQAVGLKWLGNWDDDEIFHFEWHPSWPGTPDSVHGMLSGLKKGKGNAGVWQALKYDARRPTAFRHLEDATGCIEE